MQPKALKSAEYFLELLDFSRLTSAVDGFRLIIPSSLETNYHSSSSLSHSLSLSLTHSVGYIFKILGFLLGLSHS